MRFIAFLAVLLMSAVAFAQPTPDTPMTLEQLLQGLDGHAAPKAADIIRIEGAIGHEMADTFVAQLKANEEAGQKVIFVQIDSGGGEVAAGEDMIKAIERSSAEVVCLVDWSAGSMAFHLLQSCDKRWITERGDLMAHEIAFEGVSGDYTQLHNQSDALEVWNQSLAIHSTAKSNVSLADYLGRTSNGRRWHMSAQEALKNGFVDQIVKSERAAWALIHPK